MRFIDLFAGLGGFHIALKRLGHQCVFACEKNEILSKLYEQNFNIKVHGDIKKIREDEIPEHEILCAGFPCQPFSKAGKQLGLSDKNGTYFFDDIVRIIKFHKPKYLILENVPNIKKHDTERTWKSISKELNRLGYSIKESILSPHHFGIPQIRERLFIVASTSALNYFNFPLPTNEIKLDIRDILDKNPVDAKCLDRKQLQCLDVWQRIMNAIPGGEKFPSFPIWSMEFGATYPFESKTPLVCTEEELGTYKGCFGKSLKGMAKEEQIENLPSYAVRNKDSIFPLWKQKFIRWNRDFFKKFKKQLAPLTEDLKYFPPSWQKLEWNCLDEERVLRNHIIQFRGSGIRIKRINYAPAIVLSLTQIPIIGWEDRYMTIRELGRLQSIESIKFPDNTPTAARALGNAVNAELVYLIADRLILEQQGFAEEKYGNSVARV